MADKSLFICQSCLNSFHGCMIWKFVDTNDYFGCPSYSPFAVPEEPDPPDSPFSDVPDDLERIPLIDLYDLPF